jgi:hypothetical protein
MATTKTTTTASKKKAGGKKAGRKLANRGDPPIVVGGGSAYIWILKSANPQLVDPNAPGKPPNYNDYYCFLCNAVIEGIEVNDGVPGTVPGQHKVKPDGDPTKGGKVDPKKHRTVFS